jgi:hypothetical protein
MNSYLPVNRVHIHYKDYSVMLCKDMVTVDCDNHARYTDALCDQHTIFIFMQIICIRNTVIYTFAVGQD